MSLTDRNSTLSGLSMDPLFNMGVGVMSASGPSLMRQRIYQSAQIAKQQGWLQ